MLCNICGGSLNDGAHYCVQCGTLCDWKTIQINIRGEYAYFRRFSNSTKPDDLNSEVVRNFIITDKSLILHNGEYLYDKISPIVITSNDIAYSLNSYTFNRAYVNVTRSIPISPEEAPIPSIFRNSFSEWGRIVTYTYRLDYKSSMQLEFFRSAVIVNDHVKLDTVKKKLEYALTLYVLIMKLFSILHDLPITFKKDDNLSEIYYTNKAYMNPDPKWDKLNPAYQWVEREYNYNLEKLNDFFKRENPISNAGNNRNPHTLAKLIDLMSDSDVDAQKAITEYNLLLEREKQRQEYERELERERYESGYYDESSGESILGGAAKLALGIAVGNKLSQRNNDEDDYIYTCGGWSCPAYRTHRCYKDPKYCHSKYVKKRKKSLIDKII